jgi:hypothetical protein
VVVVVGEHDIAVVVDVVAGGFVLPVEVRGVAAPVAVAGHGDAAGPVVEVVEQEGVADAVVAVVLRLLGVVQEGAVVVVVAPGLGLVVGVLPAEGLAGPEGFVVDDAGGIEAEVRGTGV